jgi:hypothetical protein
MSACMANTSAIVASSAASTCSPAPPAAPSPQPAPRGRAPVSRARLRAHGAGEILNAELPCDVRQRLLRPAVSAGLARAITCSPGTPASLLRIVGDPSRRTHPRGDRDFERQHGDSLRRRFGRRGGSEREKLHCELRQRNAAMTTTTAPTPALPTPRGPPRGERPTRLPLPARRVRPRSRRAERNATRRRDPSRTPSGPRSAGRAASTVEHGPHRVFHGAPLRGITCATVRFP